MNSIFKAYDVRGKYPSELNRETAFDIARALGGRLRSGAKLVIGYDARLSSPSLYDAVYRGLSNSGKKLKIIKAGIMTTPMLYFLVNKLKAQGGIMVTASHNPKEYNGLKVVREKARPMSGKEIFELMKIEGSAFLSYSDYGSAKSLVSRNAGFLALGRRSRLPQEQADSGAGRQGGRSEIRLYTKFLKKFLKPKKKLKVIFDCSNGTTGLVLEKLCRVNKFLDCKFINQNPDGRFPAHGPNPLLKGSTRQLEEGIKKLGADLGIIFDADGDRVFFVDNRGRFVDSNEVGYILMQLFPPPYITGIVSGWRLKQQKKTYISRVGHYFFKNLMREKKASLGLEHSGHYYFKKFFYCDSGILAALEFIDFVSGLKTDLASWLDKLPKYYRSGEINFEVSDKDKILNRIEFIYKKEVKKVIKSDGLTMEFKDYWFNLRPSNTENLLRLNLEAKEKTVLNQRLSILYKEITTDSS